MNLQLTDAEVDFLTYSILPAYMQEMNRIRNQADVQANARLLAQFTEQRDRALALRDKLEAA